MGAITMLFGGKMKSVKEKNDRRAKRILDSLYANEPRKLLKQKIPYPSVKNWFLNNGMIDEAIDEFGSAIIGKGEKGYYSLLIARNATEQKIKGDVIHRLLCRCGGSGANVLLSVFSTEKKARQWADSINTHIQYFKI